MNCNSCNNHYETQVNDFVRASINIDKLSDFFLKDNMSKLLIEEINRYSQHQNNQYLFCDNDPHKGSAAFAIFSNLVTAILDQIEVPIVTAQKAAAHFMYVSWHFEVPSDWYHTD